MRKKGSDPVVSPEREFDRIIQALSHRYERWRVFSDFCEMAACAFDNAVVKREEREQQYLKVVARYEKEEVEQLSHLLSYVIMALDVPEPQDFLGVAFQRLELSSHWKGQFFTPHSISMLMAQMTVDSGVKQAVEERGYVTVAEPAVGAGGMVIAFATALRSQGIEPQRQAFFEARDIDSTCVHMTMIQLSLLGLPATIILGDTLKMEQRDIFYTPAFHLGLWQHRLKERNKDGT